MVRRTVSFEDEVLARIEDYRRKQKKIPPFSQAVNTLIKNGSKTS